jgi:RimJ/RimL family protein N-acetyltransferase
MAKIFSVPAYRVESERTIIRCYRPHDAPLLKKAIDESLDHLRNWMPWAIAEPEPVSKKIERIRRWRAEFDQGRDFTYGVFNLSEDRVLGGTGLHNRLGGNALEIGYWIHAEHINQGLATEISAALTKTAFEVYKVERVEIHCDSSNKRSAKIPLKLGYTHDGTLRKRALDPKGNLLDVMIWSLFAEEYKSSPASQAPIKVYDVIDKQLI